MFDLVFVYKPLATVRECLAIVEVRGMQERLDAPCVSSR